MTHGLSLRPQRTAYIPIGPTPGSALAFHTANGGSQPARCEGIGISMEASALKEGVEAAMGGLMRESEGGAWDCVFCGESLHPPLAPQLLRVGTEGCFHLIG